jgi:hypothetical protein
MKRRDLLQHLKQYGCRLLREGGRNSWWENPIANRRSAVPNNLLVKKICKDLGVEPPAS